MQEKFTSNITGRIIAGNTQYDLTIIGDRFVLSRQYLGRGLDSEWTGSLKNKAFEFDGELHEELKIYANEINENQECQYEIEGKYGSLGNKIQRIPLYKKIIKYV